MRKVYVILLFLIANIPHGHASEAHNSCPKHLTLTDFKTLLNGEFINNWEISNINQAQQVLGSIEQHSQGKKEGGVFTCLAKLMSMPAQCLCHYSQDTALSIVLIEHLKVEF